MFSGYISGLGDIFRSFLVNDKISPILLFSLRKTNRGDPRRHRTHTKTFPSPVRFDCLHVNLVHFELRSSESLVKRYPTGDVSRTLVPHRTGNVFDIELDFDSHPGEMAWTFQLVESGGPPVEHHVRPEVAGDEDAEMDMMDGGAEVKRLERADCIRRKEPISAEKKFTTYELAYIETVDVDFPKAGTQIDKTGKPTNEVVVVAYDIRSVPKRELGQIAQSDWRATAGEEIEEDPSGGGVDIDGDLLDLWPSLPVTNLAGADRYGLHGVRMCAVARLVLSNRDVLYLQVR